MIVHSVCNSCLQPYELILEASELPLIKQLTDESGHTTPCPRLCGGRINIVGDPTITEMGKKLKAPMQISGRDLYQAVNGMGLPDEIPSSPELIQSLLLSEKVKKVSVEEHNGKFYLHEIQLSGGTTLHLSAGLKGAQVLKVTKARRKKNGSPSPR